MNKHLVLILLFVAALATSAINPHDHFTWMLEVLPAIVGVAVLVVTYKRFQFTYFTYVFILLHCYILIIGGHYTYAEVPAFNWIRDTFHQTRNNYDKLGHFAQGFVPAIITRELIIRLNVLQKRSWLPFLVVSICLAISAAYEFIEWLVSVLTGEGGDAFLGTQGYVWDTQSDMLCATVGAICMLIFLSKWHDWAINKQGKPISK